MKRTFKKSLALFLSAALLLSNSLVTVADVQGLQNPP